MIETKTATNRSGDPHAGIADLAALILLWQSLSPDNGDLRRGRCSVRTFEKPGEFAYYLCLAPAYATMAHLVKEAAGQRWNKRMLLRSGQAGDGEVQSWRSRYPVLHRSGQAENGQ